MKYMTTCCCGCCTVETGTKVLSILGAISSTIGFFSSITSSVGSNLPPSFHDLTVSQAVFGAIGALLSVLCVVGAVQKRRHFILPYLVFQGLSMVYMAVFFIVLLIALAAAATESKAASNDPKTNTQPVSFDDAYLPAIIAAAVGMVLYFILSLYFFFVVLSYYKALERAECNDHEPLQDGAGTSDDPPPYSREDKPNEHCP